MKVVVCGSRTWLDEGAIVRRIGELPKGSTVIHGAACGADRMAAAAAQKRGLRVKAFYADWVRYERRAGILRNLEMLDQEPELVIAFWKDGSKGTEHTVTEARRRGIPVEVIEG